jgi:hypothetical protein
MMNFDDFSAYMAGSCITVNYFHVSFEKQDKLQLAIEKIKSLEELTIDADHNYIFKRLTVTDHKATLKEL